MSSPWKNLFTPKRAERELDAELRDHLERQTAYNIERGMSPEEARRVASMKLDGVEKVKEECRDERPARFLNDLWRDLRHSTRALLRRPGFTALATITMALGIGANTAVFSVVYGVLIRPLPFAHGNRVVVLKSSPAKADLNLGFSAKEVADVQSQMQTLDAVSEHHSMSFLLLGGEEPLRVQTGVVSPGFFDLLGVKPVYGRTFTDEDNRKEGPGVLILTDGFWRKHYGADPNIVGRVFQMNNRPHTVIGVLPPIPQYPVQDDVYMPVSHCPFRSSPASEANRTARFSTLLGRLKPGAQLAQSQTDLSVIAARMSQTYPETYKPESTGYVIKVDMLRDLLSNRARENIAPLLAAAACVLLIACASVANLMLARVMRLEREMAIRAALGATRGRLIRQLLTESMLLSLTGGALGLLFAPFALIFLTNLAERFSARSGEIRIDLPVLLFTLVVSLLTGIVFGLAPAAGFGRSFNDSLKEGGKTTEGRGQNRLRQVLVVAQLAFSFVLLAGAGLALHSLWKLVTVDGGYKADHVLAMRMSPSFTRYNQTEKVQALLTKILDDVHAVPGVRYAALASSYPLSPNAINGFLNNTRFMVEGRPIPQGQIAPQVEVVYASPEYLDTVGIPLIRGRWFTELDTKESLKVVVINESMARHRWPGEDPIGKRISFDSGDTWWKVEGIVGDVRELGLDRPAPDQAFQSTKQGQPAINLLVRTSSEPQSVIRAVTSLIHTDGSDVAVDRVRTLMQVRQESVASPILTATLLSVFAILALLITSVGLGGVLALGVSQRRQELGIRMALGASHVTVVRMVLGQGLRMVGLGIAVGLPLSLALTRLVSALLYDAQPNDVLTLTCVTVLLLLVAVVACVVPARQATRIHPLVALRSE